jgi:hypothetical protein
VLLRSGCWRSRPPSAPPRPKAPSRRRQTPFTSRSGGVRCGRRAEIKPIVEFGYLTIESDGNQISVVFKTAITKGVAVADSVSVDLKTGKLSSGSAASFKKSPTNTPTKKTKSKKTRSTR